jgi:hypothetical protein
MNFCFRTSSVLRRGRQRERAGRGERKVEGEGSCGGILGDQKGKGDRGGREAVVGGGIKSCGHSVLVLVEKDDSSAGGGKKRRRKVGAAG